jgi:hypothetical protein
MKQCGLATPGRSDDAQEFSGADFETNILQSRQSATLP